MGIEVDPPETLIAVAVGGEVAAGEVVRFKKMPLTDWRRDNLGTIGGGEATGVTTITMTMDTIDGVMMVGLEMDVVVVVVEVETNVVVEVEKDAAVVVEEVETDVVVVEAVETDVVEVTVECASLTVRLAVQVEEVETRSAVEAAIWETVGAEDIKDLVVGIQIVATASPAIEGPEMTMSMRTRSFASKMLEVEGADEAMVLADMLDVMETRDLVTISSMTRVTMKDTTTTDMGMVTDTTVATLKEVATIHSLPMVDEAVGASDGVVVGFPEEVEVEIVAIKKVSRPKLLAMRVMSRKNLLDKHPTTRATIHRR